MRIKLTSTIGWTAAALLLVVGIFWLNDETTHATDGDITGVVTGLSGPEAGVWVIAETDDLEPTATASSTSTARVSPTSSTSGCRGSG